MILGYPELKARLESEGKPVVVLDILQEVNEWVNPPYLAVTHKLKIVCPAIPLCTLSRKSRSLTTASLLTSTSLRCQSITL